MKASEKISKYPAVVVATEPQINTLFAQMIQNLTAAVSKYGQDETSAMWRFHTLVGLLHGQVTEQFQGKNSGRLLIWILNETRPYVLQNCQPINRSLASYVEQLITDVFDYLGPCLPNLLTEENYVSGFEQIDQALEELADILVKSNELSFVDLFGQLALLNDIREAIRPEAVLEKVVAAHSSQEV